MKTQFAVFTTYRNEANEPTGGVYVGTVTTLEGEDAHDGVSEKIVMRGDVSSLAHECDSKEEALAVAEMVSLEKCLPRVAELD